MLCPSLVSPGVLRDHLLPRAGGLWGYWEESSVTLGTCTRDGLIKPPGGAHQVLLALGWAVGETTAQTALLAWTKTPRAMCASHLPRQ